MVMYEDVDGVVSLNYEYPVSRDKVVYDLVNAPIDNDNPMWFRGKKEKPAVDTHIKFFPDKTFLLRKEDKLPDVIQSVVEEVTKVKGWTLNTEKSNNFEVVFNLLVKD